MMKLPGPLRNRGNQIIRRAWVTLGIPFDVPMVNEKREGIIDVEALLFMTLIFMKRDRLITDVPAWIVQFDDLINFQKLKTIVALSPEKHIETLIARLKKSPFVSMPTSFRKIFLLQERPSTKMMETVRMRSSKLNSVNHVSQSSLMLHNRLLYGTGFRADLITVTHILNLKKSGKELAELLCTANSTISRILGDLRACRFLDKDNERVRLTNSYPGMLLSTQSVRNLYEILDAEAFNAEELKKTTYENLDFKHDKFCNKLMTGKL